MDARNNSIDETVKQALDSLSFTPKEALWDNISAQIPSQTHHGNKGRHNYLLGVLLLISLSAGAVYWMNQGVLEIEPIQLTNEMPRVSSKPKKGFDRPIINNHYHINNAYDVDKKTVNTPVSTIRKRKSILKNNVLVDKTGSDLTKTSIEVIDPKFPYSNQFESLLPTDFEESKLRKVKFYFAGASQMALFKYNTNVTSNKKYSSLNVDEKYAISNGIKLGYFLNNRYDIALGILYTKRPKVTQVLSDGQYETLWLNFEGTYLDIPLAITKHHINEYFAFNTGVGIQTHVNLSKNDYFIQQVLGEAIYKVKLKRASLGFSGLLHAGLSKRLYRNLFLDANAMLNFSLTPIVQQKTYRPPLNPHFINMGLQLQLRYHL